MKSYKEWQLKEEREFGVDKLLDVIIRQLQGIKDSWEHVELDDRGKIQQLQNLYKQYGQAVEQFADELIDTEPEPTRQIPGVPMPKFPSIRKQ